MGSVIIPPPDIRNVIDKTAIFVFKNGKQFEERIYQKERHNPKFCFLNEPDPYHGYYQKRLEELIEGGQEAVSKLHQEMQEQQKQQGGENSVEAGHESVPRPKEPSPLLFTLHIPNISPLDLDIIKLTALYVARNGKTFQANIARKEYGNIQFDFLKPTHSLHRLFLRLVDQFSLVLLPTERVIERMERCKNKYGLLEEIMKERVEYAKWEEVQQRRAVAQASREQEEYNKIAWSEFVVVETIEFSTADKQIELPKPLDLTSITNMTVVQREDLWNNGLGLATKRSQVDVEMEIETEPAIKRTQLDADGVNVKYDYKPKAQQSVVPGEQTVTCSICNQLIPSSQIEEHMRVELLDSKWAEQRKAYLAKHVDTNIVESGTDVSRNLAAMNRSMSSQDKQANLSQRVIWDGTAASVPAATREAAVKSKDQIQREIEELQRQGGDSAAIGPIMQQTMQNPPYGYYGHFYPHYPQQPYSPQAPPYPAHGQPYPPPGQYPQHQAYPPGYQYPYQYPYPYYPPGQQPPPAAPK